MASKSTESTPNNYCASFDKVPDTEELNKQCIPMGWLWFLGSMKLQVSFAKEPYKRANILQKRPIILSILLTVATLYHECFQNIASKSFLPLSYGV